MLHSVLVSDVQNCYTAAARGYGRFQANSKAPSIRSSHVQLANNSSFLLLVVWPGATNSVLAPSSDARFTTSDGLQPDFNLQIIFIIQQFSHLPIINLTPPLFGNSQAMFPCRCLQAFSRVCGTACHRVNQEYSRFYTSCG